MTYHDDIQRPFRRSEGVLCHRTASKEEVDDMSRGAVPDLQD